MSGKTTATFYFCNNFAKPLSILRIFGTHILKFPSPACFTFFTYMKTKNQLKFQQYNTPAHHKRTNVTLLYHEMLDFIINLTLTSLTAILLTSTCAKWRRLEAKPDWQLVKHPADGHEKVKEGHTQS